MNALRKTHQSDLMNFLTSYKCLRQQIHTYAADLKKALGTATSTFVSIEFNESKHGTGQMIKDTAPQIEYGETNAMVDTNFMKS